MVAISRIPKTSPESVAPPSSTEWRAEEEEIFPDPFSLTQAESWRNGCAKELERQNAALVAEEPVAA